MDQHNQKENRKFSRGETERTFPFWPSDPASFQTTLKHEAKLNHESKARTRNFLIALIVGACLTAGGIGIGIAVGVSTTSAEPENAQSPVSAESLQQQNSPTVISKNMEEPVAAVAEAVAPSVVKIDTATGTGSGIIYDTNGAVVTNAHVVQGVKSVEIQLADGTRATGSVIGSDPNVDIAILRIQGGLSVEPATFAELSTVRVGQLAVAIGSPFGLEQSVTAGIVSALNRAVPSFNIEDGSRTVVEMIQTDAPINPGNSGGALVDRQGRVIGMNTLIRTDGTVEGNLGVGFAIPADTIFLVTERIINGESLDNGFLGISGQNPTLGRAGALVIDVVPDSPAYESGLEPGDLIVATDGMPILGMSELAARIRLSSPGTMVEVQVIRNGEEMTFEVVLGTLGSFD
ncbi:MAG: trypsin-like peptidase domain-containing protein [Actinomycetota bacterium]|nr:trypsin-like peptidase domain-containing protein [Actinomycetota bacterium]